MHDYIAVLNQSTLVTDSDAQIMTRAVAKQARYHFAPAWGAQAAAVVFHSSQTDIPPRAWVISLFDDPDQAGVLGWHTEDPHGNPYGRVFVRPVLSNGGAALSASSGLTVASVLSHEVLEAIADPFISLWADRGDGSAVAYEVCDPVESRSYVITVPGDPDVMVSDFVTPRWFDPQAPTGTQFSYLHAVDAPFKLDSGGYCVVMKEGTTSQTFGEHYPDWKLALKSAPAGRSSRRI